MTCTNLSEVTVFSSPEMDRCRKCPGCQADKFRLVFDKTSDENLQWSACMRRWNGCQGTERPGLSCRPVPIQARPTGNSFPVEFRCPRQSTWVWSWKSAMRLLDRQLKTDRRFQCMTSPLHTAAKTNSMNIRAVVALMTTPRGTALRALKAEYSIDYIRLALREAESCRAEVLSWHCEKVVASMDCRSEWKLGLQPAAGWRVGLVNLHFES